MVRGELGGRHPLVAARVRRRTTRAARRVAVDVRRPRRADVRAGRGPAAVPAGLDRERGVPDAGGEAVGEGPRRRRGARVHGEEGVAVGPDARVSGGSEDVDRVCAGAALPDPQRRHAELCEHRGHVVRVLGAAVYAD